MKGVDQEAVGGRLAVEQREGAGGQPAATRKFMGERGPGTVLLEFTVQVEELHGIKPLDLEADLVADAGGQLDRFAAASVHPPGEHPAVHGQLDFAPGHHFADQLIRRLPLHHVPRVADRQLSRPTQLMQPDLRADLKQLWVWCPAVEPKQQGTQIGASQGERHR